MALIRKSGGSSDEIEEIGGSLPCHQASALSFASIIFDLRRIGLVRRFLAGGTLFLTEQHQDIGWFEHVVTRVARD